MAMKRLALATTLLALMVAATPAQGHRYDRWGQATLGDFNYAVAWLCGGSSISCESRKTDANIAVKVSTDHTWVTKTKNDSGGTSNWTHREQAWWGGRTQCYTVAYSYHGQLVGIDRGGSPPYEFCDPL